jgi:hypothetical protein
MFLNMIHPSFVSLKFQFQIHIYHNSLLICYKNLLIVKLFSRPLPVFFSSPKAWANPSPRLHQARLLPARSRSRLPKNLFGEQVGEGRSDG